MGSSASTTSATGGGIPVGQMVPSMIVGGSVDAYDPKTKLWWPAEIMEIHREGRKPHYIIVRCENEAECKIKFGAPKYNKMLYKKIAGLGTHTRETLNATAAADQLSAFNSSSNISSDDSRVKRKAKAKQEEDSQDETNSENGEESSFDISHIESDDQFDILDIYTSSKTGKTTKRWRASTIMKTSNEKVLVHFEGWSHDFNVWINLKESPERIAPYGQYSGSERSIDPQSSSTRSTNNTTAILDDPDTDLKELRLHDECYGKDEYISKKTGELAFLWRHATVVDTLPDSVKLHFTNWNESWDAWFDINGGKLMTVSQYEATIGASKEQENNSGELLSNVPAHEKGQPLPSSSSSSSSSNQEGLKKNQLTRNNERVYMIRKTMPRTRGDGFVGLENLGNTCFMNSCLQCLLNTAPLAAYFLEDDHLQESNPKSLSNGRFASAFGEFMQDYWSTRSHGVARAPRQLKKVIGRFARQFSGFAQHDAQELLRYLLEGLHEDLNRIHTKPPYEEIKDDPSLNEAEKCAIWWNNYEDRNNSSIKDIFCGQLRSFVTCRTCGHRSSAYDPFWDLSLPLTSKRKCNIQDCLKSFASDETLSGNDAYYCSKCKKHRKSTKNMSIQRWPPILCLHIKRFQGSTKMKTKVTFPTTGLDLSKINSVISETAENQPDPVYHLMGVSNHMGGLHSGHYTADCRSPKTGEWNHFDDDRVSPSSESDLSKMAAYILFYAREDVAQG